MEQSRLINPFNKIGFHIDSDPDFNTRLLYDWMWQLNDAGIPVFLKSADNYRPIQEALEWVMESGVPHTFLYRLSANQRNTDSKLPTFNFDEPNYELDPKEAANRHWRAILSNLPSDFDPARVWLEVLHEPNESYADWLGFFAMEISQIALEQDFQLALFGWGNRQPGREAWYQGGLVEFLHLCQERPDQLAISLHEYSHNPQTLFESAESGIGYFRELIAASRDKEMSPPTIFISEWGWRRDEMPNPELALEHIHQAGQLYAQYPEIKGAAMWTLGMRQVSQISEEVEWLIKPLTDFSLNVRFETSEDTAVPIPEDTDYINDYAQTAVPITEAPDDIPDYSAQFLGDATIPDGAKIEPGSSFIKKWRVYNDGRLPWNNDCQILFTGGASLTLAISAPLPSISPGEEGEIQLELQAPRKPGTYQAIYGLLDPSGNPFNGDDQLTVNIVVPGRPDAPDHNARFLNHVTIADGMEIPIGDPINKAWRVKNTGRLPWNEKFQLVQQDNTPLGKTLSFPILEKQDDVVPPGQLANIRINLSAPSQPGNYTAEWRLQDDQGNYFGDPLKMAITAIPNVEMVAAMPLYNEDPDFENVAGSDESDEFPETFEYRAQFVTDVTIPDDSKISPGTSFVKTWLVRNNGRRPWPEGSSLVFTDGAQMADQDAYPAPAIEPGKTTEIAIQMIAPQQPGAYFSDWRFREPQGNFFGDTVFARIVVPEAVIEPDDPSVWFYIGSSDSQQQMDALTQAPDLTWAANKNTKKGDLVLMYRDGRYQDFAYLFHALDDAYEQDMAIAPVGWKKSWKHAIRLGQKQALDNPVSRHLLKTHPDLRNWRPISHSPQGIMKRTQGLNLGPGGEARWRAIRGILVGWNPEAADYLAKFDQITSYEIFDDAITAVSALPDSENRREGLLNIIRHLGTQPEFADLQQKLSQDADWQVKKEALHQLGEEEPDEEDILKEANALVNRQRFQQTINFLEKEAPEWQKSNNDNQAKGHRLLGEAYQGIGQTESALSHWQQAARLNPNDVTTFDKIGRHTPSEKRDEVEKFMAETSSAADKAAGPLAGQAAIAEKHGQPEKAAVLLEEAKTKAEPAQKREIEVIERRVIQYLPQREMAVPFPPASDDPIIHERKQKLFNILRENFNTTEIKQLCFELENIQYENIPGRTLNEKAFGLVEMMARHGRLAELVEKIKAKRSELAHLFQETASDIIAAARALLRRQQPQQAIAILQAKTALWQIINDQAVRADAHAILAQAYAATGQTDLAFAQWKLKAPLTPNAADAFLGLVRAAADSELDDLGQWLETMRQQHPTAVGPLTGLAALLSRQNKPQEAAQLLAQARTGNPTQDRALMRTAEAIEAKPEQALDSLANTAVTPTTATPDSNRLTAAMNGLAVAHTPLDASDQESVFREIVQQILSLPTLSPVHKREFRDRARRVLAEVRQTGQFTPQHAADLRLPVLDNLFITDPARRRALVHAAAAYRQQPGRRLRLYLRARARRQMRRHLTADHVKKFLGNDGADRAQAFADLQTAVWHAGTVNDTPLQDWLANNQAASRAMRDRRTDNLTITGNLCYDLPSHLLQPFPDDDPALWQAIYDLRHNDAPIFQRRDSWGRLTLNRLDDQMSSLILYAFEPDEHLPYHPETAVAALKNLELPERANNLDYPGFIAFARQLLQDDDLGFASLDDAACFLAQIADDEDKNVTFAPGDEPASYANLLPPLAAELKMPVKAFDTTLTLPDAAFSQMARALSAGNHIILIGPPGTGKTSIAQDICALAHDLNASRGVIAVTATADWTTFDTVGGYMPADDGRLTFREGIILRAIREQKWVIIDEINRAEIDKAFGELFTVLSGQAITLPYRDGSAPIRIVPADFPGKTARDYVISPGWRIIGTMNVFDKASLFEMSYAFMRRFAFVDVGIPRPNNIFMELIDRWLSEFNLPAEAENGIVTALKTHIFAADSDIMKHRQLGPAIALDMISYISQCQKQGEPISLQHVGEAFLLYAVPQFDGLDEPTVLKIYQHVNTVFANTDALAEIQRRMQDLFPQYDLAEALTVTETEQE